MNTSWSGQRRSFPTATRNRIMERDKWECQIKGPECKCRATQADHIKNWAEGGTDDLANGQAVCDPCHREKTLSETIRGRKRHSRYRDPMQHPGLG